MLFKFVKQSYQWFASIHNISEYVIFCEIHYKIENVISKFFILKINIYCIFERKLIYLFYNLHQKQIYIRKKIEKEDSIKIIAILKDVV